MKCGEDVDKTQNPLRILLDRPDIGLGKDKDKD